MEATSCADVLNKMLCGYSDLLTVSDLMKITGRSERELRIAINSGRLPGCRIGNKLLVLKSRFIELLVSGASNE